jgi:hypothetical protein
MAFTRKQAKQQQEQLQEQEDIKNIKHMQQKHEKHNHRIDFIDASIEWRKNKIKRENGTFEYIM